MKQKPGLFVGITSRVVLIAVTLAVVFPFLWMIVLSFKSNTEVFNNPFSLPNFADFQNYARAFATVDLWLLYRNTIVIAVFSLAIEIVITFMSSFALSKMVFRATRLKRFFYVFLLAGLAIPPYILLFPVYRLTVLFGLANTFFSLVVTYVATSISFNTLLFTGFLGELPKEIDEASVMDGSGLARLCVSVIAPISKPVIVTVFIFNVLYIWNEFPFASILISKASMYTLSLGASFFKGQWSVDYTGIIATSVLVIIPQLVFFGVFQRYIVEGMTAGAVKG